MSQCQLSEVNLTTYKIIKTSQARAYLLSEVDKLFTQLFHCTSTIVSSSAMSLFRGAYS